MPKGQKKFNNLKFFPIKVSLLLVQFILIKTGLLPLLIFKFLFIVIRKILTALSITLSHLSKFKVKKKKKTAVIKKVFSHLQETFQARIYKVKLSWPNTNQWRWGSKRGRPRNTWFIPYYLTKIKLYIKRRVPLKTKIAFTGGLILTIIYIYTYLIFAVSYQLPSPKKLVSADKALTTEFFDRNGKLLYRLYEGRNRTLVPLNELPPFLVQATLAAEDRNFYKHPGVDPLAIIRAIRSNLKKEQTKDGGNLEGASTITQQLIKNSLLTPEKTYIRKAKEIILSLWAERMYSKDEILQMYLSEAPYGGTAWGVEAAAQTYFGQSARNLTLAQAAYIAGLPASPTQFSPYGSNPELGKDRQKEVLRRMIENKFITQVQADKAYEEDLHLRPQIHNIQAAHFVMYVKDLLSQKYGQRVVSQGGLKITTTLDLNIQSQVEKIISDEVTKLSALNVGNGAAMVTDAKTGQILAMMGSRDYHEPGFGSFNVSLALRQPGSSIKIVTFATGFKLGFSPGNTILDVPVVFRDNWGNAYSPVNYDGSYHGAVSIRQALGSSYNIPAVKMLATVGVDETIDTAKDLGITTFTDPKRYGLALTLGGAEVKMIDMMTVYGAFAQMGTKNISTPILKVTDSNGNVLEEYENNSTPVLTPEVAYLITDVLSDNTARTPAFGANSLLKIPGHTVAVKTGTSDNKRDNWTFGYTPEYVVGTWVGNNNNSPMDSRLASGVTGAAPIWNKIMTSLLSGKKDLAFARPKGIVEGRIDGRKDLAIASNLPKSLVRTTQKENKLVFLDPYSSYASPSARLDAANDTQQAQANLP